VGGLSNFRRLFFEFAGVQVPGGQEGMRGILNRQARLGGRLRESWADPREINFDDQDVGMFGEEKPNKRVCDGGGRGHGEAALHSCEYAASDP
jgi:hypothetical protein